MPLRAARLARVPGAACPVFHGCRPLHTTCTLAAASSAASGKVNDDPAGLDGTLRGQDKFKRITFLPPRRYSLVPEEEQRQRLVTRWIFGSVVAEAHLLPFYMVNYLSDVRFSLQQTDGSNPRGSYGVGDKRYHTSVGMSVAAVPANHWAHGLVLREDLQYFMSEATHVCVGSHDRSKPTLSTACYTKGGPDMEPYIADRFNPERMPPFAFGPPRLSAAEQQQLVSLQRNFPDEFLAELEYDNVMEVMELQSDMAAYFFPHYRLVYKVNLDSRNIRIVDTSTHLSYSMFNFNRLHKTPAIHPSFRDDKALPSQYYRNAYEARGDPRYNHILARICQNEFTSSETAQLYDIVVRAMSRNAINDHTWNDSSIFPMTMGDMKPIHNYINGLLAGMPTGNVAPKFQVGSSDNQELSQHLRVRSTPTRPPPGKAKTEQPPPPPPPKGKPKASGGANPFATSRTAERSSDLASRLRGALNRQKAWQGGPTGKKERKPSSKPAAKAQPVATVVHDLRGFYRIMQIKPSADFVQPALEVHINNELKRKYHELSLRYHPDLAATPEEQIRMNKMMTEINIAYSEIDQCGKRIKYQNDISTES